MRRFANSGLAGLREGEHSGRPQRLNAGQVAKINAILRQTPRDAGLSRNLWDGKALSAWIEREYGVGLGVRQCQRLLRRLDFRLRKPRPMPGKRDPAVQQQHKKLQALMPDSTFMHRRARASDTLAPCANGTASSCSGRKRVDATRRVSFGSS